MQNVGVVNSRMDCFLGIGVIYSCGGAYTLQRVVCVVVGVFSAKGTVRLRLGTCCPCFCGVLGMCVVSSVSGEGYG